MEAVMVDLVVLLAVTATAFTLSLSDHPNQSLTFAENVYVKLSSACRAMVDLRYSATRGDGLIKNMKIVQIDGNTMKTYQIDEAFVSLARSSVFDITKQTKIIIHGYKDSAISALPLDLARAYNDKAMFNVLMVDAEEVVNKSYLLSVHNARLVGKRLANLLANLEMYGANADDIHLLGISLGAHIAGWTGKYFRQYNGRSIGRITGLDPAGPCFSYAISDQRLDKGDALYVDIVHSNRLIQGVIEPLGHADFYVNGGGPNQPGCFTSRCSHLRATMLYTESVRNPKSFVGIRCQSWKHFTANECKGCEYAVLGYGSSDKNRGVYYLRTTSNSPYGLGMEGTKSIPLIDNLLMTFNDT